MRTRSRRGGTKRFRGGAGNGLGTAAPVRGDDTVNGGASGNMITDVATLKKLLAGGSKGSRAGDEGHVDEYEVVSDPRVDGIQRNLAKRWQREFVQGQAEGIAGKDQSALLDSGPRHTIESLDRPLRYTASGSNLQRKTRVQRMIEAGNASGALHRMKSFRYRGRNAVKMDPRKLTVDDDNLSTQVGLHHLSKETLKRIKGERRLDYAN